MSKDFKENAGEVVDAMPAPDVVTLKASVESKGVFLAGGVNNRPLDGLSTGFRYWKKGQPSTAKEIAASVEYKEVFAVMLEEALSGGEYEVLAFATDEDGRTVEGDKLSFVSGNAPQPDHEAVDLGLPSGLKWATMNVGANAPEEYGDYFAWGETSPKSDYSWWTYKYANGVYDKLTKYCGMTNLGNNGFTDALTTLEMTDDAARVNWGGSWRMPTDEEWTELRTKCTWTWTTRNGVNGRLVTGPNGSSIFLSAAGGWFGTDLYDVGSLGYYWSSSLSTAWWPISAWNVHISFVNVNRDNGQSRCIGLSVRPVTE